MRPTVEFRVTHRAGAARRGVMTTPHGDVETPAFMPVGTQGAVKAVVHRDLLDLGAEIILTNTYHLWLRPTDERIARLGGLHRFIGWDRPILTDSGGYQVFSLAARRTVTEEGVRFRSHLDGSDHALTPERAADIQARLGSDIAMALDECLAYPATADEARVSMERTLRWARRGRARFLALRTIASDHAGSEGGSGPAEDPDPNTATTPTNRGQAQFGIVQGSVYRDLRQMSASETVALGFEGYAIGGLGVGEPIDVMYDVVAETVPLLPADRPRYLMGVGTPADLVESVARGIDLFDCVLPTRNARNGQLFTSAGRLNIKNARYADDPAPPDNTCCCYTCRTCSRAYLRHLFMSGEIAAATLGTVHNLHFYLDTMRRIREAITFGAFEAFRQGFYPVDSRRSPTS